MAILINFCYHSTINLICFNRYFGRQLQEADRGCRGDRGPQLGQVPEGSAAAGRVGRKNENCRIANDQIGRNGKNGNESPGKNRECF